MATARPTPTDSDATAVLTWTLTLTLALVSSGVLVTTFALGGDVGMASMTLESPLEIALAAVALPAFAVGAFAREFDLL